MAAAQQRPSTTGDSHRGYGGGPEDSNALLLSTLFDAKVVGSRSRSDGRHGDGSKVKRALRRRIKPVQQRCSERMSGPGSLFDQSKALPKLPRGGDGLAVISLRPSLVQKRYDAFQTTSIAPTGRPATAWHQLGSRSGATHSSYNCSRARSMSAPPIDADSGDGILVDQQDLTLQSLEVHSTTNKLLRQLPPDSAQETHSASSEAAEGVRMTPLRPAGEKRRSQSCYADAGRRTIRDVESKARLKGMLQVSAGQKDKSAEEELAYQHETLSTGCVEEAEIYDKVLLDKIELDAENEDAGSQAVEERSATVVHSSTVLLSPRGRSKSPTILVDGSPIWGSVGDGASIQFGTDEWISPGPRRTAPDNDCSLQTWPAPTSSPSTRYMAPLTTDSDIKQHLAREVRPVGVVHNLCHAPDLVPVPG